MAFRSFAHWTSSESAPRAERVVTRLRCIGRLSAEDVAEIRRMSRLRELVLEGIDTFPRELCGLPELRVLTINGRGEDGIASLPEEIRKLSGLRTLRVRARRLSSLPDSIVDLRELVELDLRHSGVRRLPDRVMELPKLRWISLAP